MRKALVTALAVILVFSFMGCTARQTTINSFVLPGAVVGGDPAKDIAPTDNIIVWPLINVAVGSKAKGVEMVLTDYLIDTLYLNNTFKSVYIVYEAEAKDLLARAGEELGLKKKPKDPVQDALIATKLGQLTGADAILIGRLDDYDEVKVDKNTFTGVGISFFLTDAREQSYPTLDSFTPGKALWRANSIRWAKETAFQARQSLHETSRILIRQMVKRMERDLRKGSTILRKAQEKKIKGLKKEASKQRKAGEYDNAVATWNSILKLDPNDPDAAEGIAKIEREKKEAEEKEKSRQLKEQISGMKDEAGQLEKEGDLEGARQKWEEILELNPEEKGAGKKIESLNKAIADREAAEKEKELSANLHLAQKALGEMKYTDAIAAAEKVLAVEPDNAKAQSIIEAAEQKIEEAKAAEEEVTSAPEEVPAAEPEAEPEEEVPAAEPEAEPEEEVPAAEPEAEPEEEVPAAEPEAEPEEEVPAAEPEAEPEEEVPAAEPEAEPEEEVPAVPAAEPEEEVPAVPAAEPEEEVPAVPAAEGADVEGLRNQAMEYFNTEEYEKAEESWKKLLEIAPDDKQAQEMLETTQMLIEALK